MPEPTSYAPEFDFTATDKGTELNVELQNISNSTESLADAVSDLRRSDGALQNKIVTVESLSDGLVAELSGSVTADAEAARDAAEGFAAAASTSATTSSTQAGIATSAATSAGASATSADADAAATAADRAQTGLDRIATAADRVQTGLDAASTAADRVQTGLDATATGADATATAADRVQTGLDAAATAADRVQTGLDAAATGADRTYLDALAATAPFPRKNLATDPWGLVNQAGYVSGTATSGANAYTLDAVFIVTSGQSLTWAGDGAARVLTFPAGGGGWVIDGADIRTGSHVINWNGTATCTVNGVARTKGEVFTLTAGTKVTVRFFGGTVAGWKLEEGTVPTPIEFANERDEMQSVRKSYTRLIVSSGGTSSGAGAQYADAIVLPVRMRATPTVSTSGGTVANVTVVAVDNPSRDSARMLTTVTTAAAWNYLNRVLEADARLTP